jgi:hypothetical protein
MIKMTDTGEPASELTRKWNLSGARGSTRRSAAEPGLVLAGVRRLVRG